MNKRYCKTEKTGKYWKTVLNIVLVCFMILMCCAWMTLAAYGADDADMLTVGVPNNRCPIFYEDQETGEIVGIGVDLMRIAAEKAGYEADFRFIEEDTLSDALDNVEYDVLMPFGSAVDSTSGRSSIVSENMFQTPFTLMTTGKRELPPLNDLKVGMLRSLGAGAVTVQELYPGIQINMYETMPECVDALRAGKVDALLHNSYVWSYVLQKPAYSDLTVQPTDMFAMDFRAGTLDTEKGREIIERLNRGIEKISDTHRQAVILDYTSRKLYRYDLSDYLYQYWMAILLVVLLIALIISFVVYKQKSFHAAQEKKLHELIDQDPVTGVLSMSGFRKRAEELLRNNPDVPYLISYNNINNFKFINDSQGMDAGNELLRFWAEKSLAVMSDREAISRIEADHFAVLRCISGEDIMLQDEKNVFKPVKNFFVEQGKGNQVQICSGVYVLTPEDYKNINIDKMLDFARVAEKRVRETRKDGYEFYNPDEWKKGRRNAEVCGHLPLAIRSGEIQVWYQPQVNYRTKKITGMEALCRWNHKKLGWLKPADFIPVLEESSLIYDLDCFVWERVCQDLHRWNKQGVRRIVSVNLSRRDVREDKNICEHFCGLIRKYELDTDQIRIEITETAYAEDPEVLIRTTRDLQEHGFKVEMDDFGSGYSSLNMLKEVPVDRIKLDLMFLTDTGDQGKSSVIVSQMIQLVQLLEMEIIAEGVETAEQAEFLNDQGCSDMQGYYFYRPMPVEEFEKLDFEN